MQNNFFGSKLNSVLLLILIILLGFVLRFMYKEKATYLPFMAGDKKEEVKDSESANTVNEVKSEVKNEQAKETYTYTNHGFSIELPKGFVFKEIKGETNPTISMELPDRSGWLIYINDLKEWEKRNPLSNTGYVKDEKIGETTFRVYYDGESVYRFNQGNVGYVFNGNSKKYMETFQFVGWPKETKCENEFCMDGLAPENIVSTKPLSYESIGISKSELEKLVIKNFGDCSMPETCSRNSIELSLADMKINGRLYQNIPIVTIIQTLADDSVSLEKYIVKIYTDPSGDNKWLFSKPYVTWACHSGRGHQGFSQESCI